MCGVLKRGCLLLRDPHLLVETLLVLLRPPLLFLNASLLLLRRNVVVRRPVLVVPPLLSPCLPAPLCLHDRASSNDLKQDCGAENWYARHPSCLRSEHNRQIVGEAAEMTARDRRGSYA